MNPTIDNTQPAEQLPTALLPKPIKYPLLPLFFWIAAISSFLMLWAQTSYAPYVSLEMRSILIEPLTPEDEKFYNDSSQEAIEIHIQEKLKQINHTPLPGWHYRARQIDGQNHIVEFKRKKFTYNEILGFLMSTPVLPILCMSSLVGLLILLCSLSFKYDKTLLVLSSRVSPPVRRLPSPIWDALLLAVPPINLVWIWPSSMRAVHYGKKLCKLCKIPYRGPSLKLALVSCFLLSSLAICLSQAIARLLFFNNAPYVSSSSIEQLLFLSIVLYFSGLLLIYLYMKKLNTFIDEMAENKLLKK